MSVPLVLGRIEAHVPQPLVKRHVSMLHIRSQLVHEFAIPIISQVPVIVLVRLGALGPRESLRARSESLSYLPAHQCPYSRRRGLPISSYIP